MGKQGRSQSQKREIESVGGSEQERASAGEDLNSDVREGELKKTGYNTGRRQSERDSKSGSESFTRQTAEIESKSKRENVSVCVRSAVLRWPAWFICLHLGAICVSGSGLRHTGAHICGNANTCLTYEGVESQTKRKG